ncbi:hypothetical protein [Terrabacter sp. Ter38]|uniref:hypothetical protein n=1 Tax=Terrabacter sp. Ter38 TaxID=2926030 RepID=UPI002117C1EF|nr:hypothetical protein [Terrabacter sp. Ter38]
MNDDKVQTQGRRKIAETLLDRAGISAGKGADVTVTHRFEQTMQDIVIDLDGPDDVEDAEVLGRLAARSCPSVRLTPPPSAPSWTCLVRSERHGSPASG